jgi:hypothetical protein
VAGLVTVRHDTRQVRLFRILAVILVALTGVMLVSASQRMLLYEAAYGFTHLRVYTQVFMFWLGALFVIFLLALFRVRERIFSLGVLAVLIGYLVTLNVMNVEQYIADHNMTGLNTAQTLTSLTCTRSRRMLPQRCCVCTMARVKIPPRAMMSDCGWQIYLRNWIN